MCAKPPIRRRNYRTPLRPTDRNGDLAGFSQGGLQWSHQHIEYTPPKREHQDMNATTVTPTFPIDRLLVCGICGAGMTLECGPEHRYACPHGCVTPLEADGLNRAVIGGIVPAVVTESTFPRLKDAVKKAISEIQADNPGFHGDDLTDEGIRALLDDPGTLMRYDEASGLLGMFVESIKVRPGQATVRYSMALPPGSPSAGSRSQEIELPEPATE